MWMSNFMENKLNSPIQHGLYALAESATDPYQNNNPQPVPPKVPPEAPPPGVPPEVPTDVPIEIPPLEPPEIPSLSPS